MANELLISYPTGATLYALLFDSTGNVWNGSSFDAPGSANWLDYDIAMSEVAGTGIYRASMPAAAAGVYGWVVRKQAGASPAVGDIAVGSGRIEWSGTAEVALTSRATQTSVDDVPTNAELATALGTADDATLAAIGALNNLSSVQAQAAAAAALNAYDPPTSAEMEARTLVAASYFDPATDTVARVTLVDTVTTLTGMPSVALTAQETANAVHNLAPVGVSAIGSIGSRLDAILNGLTGVGLLPLTYTVTESGGIVPIDGVSVEVYTEEACLNCVRRGTTNSFGIVIFWFTTPGTYWLKCAKDGYAFPLDSEVVAV